MEKKLTDAMSRSRLSFLFSCILLLFRHGLASQSSPAAAPLPDSGLENCPLNVSYLSSHPWIVQKCKDGTHCCEALDDLMKILFFSWMHQTNSFLLMDLHTSRVCMDAIQRQMERQGVASKDVFRGCNMTAADFVNGPQHCHQIQNRSAFESFVNSSEIKNSCNGYKGRFLCHVCIKALVRALRLLTQKDGREKNNCELFVIVYVGGGINAYEDLGPSAAYCILSAQNLPELAFVDAGSNPRKIDGKNAGETQKKVVMALGILFPAAAIAALLGFCAARGKFRVCRFERLVLSRRESQLMREGVDLTTGLLFFRYAELKQATGNFSASNVVGEGGFGTVFRGTLPDGSQIAVKRFNDSTTKGDEVFKHEVHVISSVKHRNLLPLKGYCIKIHSDGHQHFLVYDYMSNGSLADYLFRRGSGTGKPLLTWPQRHRVAVGIARGLAYLHGDAKPAIIHRDVKAANVLLDADLNALVADFGLARFKQEGSSKTHYSTRAVGTLGYVAPEYALYGHLTDKNDVYSFGIVLLELMSGRRALDMTDVDNTIIADWAYELAQQGRLEEVIDERIRVAEKGEGEIEAKECMERVVLLALQCVSTKPACRPSIQQTLLVLESIDRPLHPLQLPEMVSFSSTSGSTGASSDGKLTRSDWSSLSVEETARMLGFRSGSVGVSGISTASYQNGR